MLAAKQQPKKKGGPYAKEDQRLRREEVFRLHFEYGYSARKISEMMKINRHTINNDIKHHYSQLSKKGREFDIDSWFMKQVIRLENQRTRFREELEKYDNLQEKISIEKMILEIDGRLNHMAIRYATSTEKAFNAAVEALNLWAEEQNLDSRYHLPHSLNKVKVKTHEKIMKLIEDDRNS